MRGFGSQTIHKMTELGVLKPSTLYEWLIKEYAAS